MVFRCGGIFFSPSHHQKFNFPCLLSPLSYKEKIRQIPGVKGVSYGTMVQWHLYIGKTSFQTSLLSQKRFWSYIQNTVFRRPANCVHPDRKSAIVRKVLERFQWKVGDNISLKGPSSRHMGFCLGVYTTALKRARTKHNCSFTGTILMNV